MIDRARSNPRLVVAIAAGAILLLAWIGWAIYVTSSDGATAGLGVVIAWPAMLAAVALISLPFIGGYLLVRRLSTDSGTPAAASELESETDSEDGEEPDDEAEDTKAEDEGSDDDEETGKEGEGLEDGDEESEEEKGSAEEGDPDDESEDAEAEKTAG